MTEQELSELKALTSDTYMSVKLLHEVINEFILSPLTGSETRDTIRARLDCCMGATILLDNAINKLDKTSEPVKLDFRTEEQKLLDMKMHETFELSSYIEILRVVGGWIYTNYNGRMYSSVFVPLPGENS